MHRLPPLHTVNTILIGLHSTWVILYIAAIVLVSVDSKYKQEDADFLVEQCIAYVKFGVYIVLFSLIILVKYIYVSRIYLTLATVYLLDAVVSLCIILVYFGRFDNNSYQNNGKYRDEYVLFVAITNGLVILLDLVMLPVLRCFHRQDEYRKNIGLPPLSTIKRSRVYQVDDATLKNPFSTAPSLFFHNSVMLEAGSEEQISDQQPNNAGNTGNSNTGDSSVDSSGNNNNNNNNNNVIGNNRSNEIDIRTGKVYRTTSQTKHSGPSSMNPRTNSITFHGYGMSGTNKNSSSDISEHSNNDDNIFMENGEHVTSAAVGKNNSSSFLIKAKLQQKTNNRRSRANSDSSIDSASTYNDGGDSEDDTVTMKLGAQEKRNSLPAFSSGIMEEQPIDFSHNHGPLVSMTSISLGNDNGNLTEHKQKNDVIKPRVSRSTSQNTVITRPTHPPPKPPVAPTKSVGGLSLSLEALSEVKDYVDGTVPPNNKSSVFDQENVSNKINSVEYSESDHQENNEPIIMTDSLKKKIAPIKPQRPSLLRLKNASVADSTDDSNEEHTTSGELSSKENHPLPPSSRHRSPPTHPPPPPPALESPLGSDKINMINLERQKLAMQQ